MKISEIGNVVQIINKNSGAVEWESAPMHHHAANKCEKGADINLDHENYFTKIIERC